MTTASATSTAAPSKGLHIGLWVLQILLGVMFTMSGAMKATQPTGEMAVKMGMSGGLMLFIGVSEILGGLGLILPSATRIMPKLTPLAAVGLAVIMVLAAAFHASRGEFGSIGVCAVLGGLFAFIAYGRAKLAPIAPKA